MKRMFLKSYMNMVPEEVEKPVPGKGEVLVRVAKLGVCGSDISAYYGKHPYIPFEIVLGHEFTGYIDAIGPDTAAPAVGARVTVLPHRPCRNCEPCSQQRYNHCGSLIVIGCQCDGAQAEYVLAPADMIFELPPEVSMVDGALIEPIAVGYHGAKKAVKKGDRVVVLGAGGIGLFTMQSARVLGAASVVSADFSPKRLELAKKMGANDVIDLNRGELKDLLPGDVDVFIDCVGHTGQALNSIIEAAKRGTRVICIGVINSDHAIPKLPDLTEKELTFFGSNMFVPSDFADVIANLKKGAYVTDGVYTHTFDLDQVPEMYRFIDDKKEDFIKLLINISE